MIGTAELLQLLNENNPGTRVTEESLRRVIRVLPHLRPPTVGGNYVWLPDRIADLAKQLDLDMPSEPNEVPDATS